MTEKVGLRMGRASAVRLSQHLDLSAQLEVLQLKEKLQEMTDMVRQLLQHMDQLEKIPGFFSKEGTQKDTVATQTNLLEEKSLEMSPKQKSKMKELVDMNLNWQKYNALQEKHIQELHDKVEQMQQKLTTTEDNSLLLQQKLHDENSRLKAEVEKFRLRNDALQAKAAAEAKGKKAGSMEREQLLETQLMVYKEDFQTERRDREAAQARVVQLEMELMEANKRMQTTSTGYHRYRAPQYQLDGGGDLQLDGGEFHHDDDSTTTQSLATDCADGPPSWRAALPAEHNRKVFGGKLRRPAGVDNKLSGLKEDALCCTKCFKVYPQSEHLDLLDHLEECGRQ